MIDPEKIEAIRSRADIVRIIGAHVQLRKQGQRYTGLCPFHGEKSPSFSVSPDKGLFYCFGCHARGDVFSFVGQMQGLDFTAAARWLAKEVGVELQAESPAEANKRKLESNVADVNRYALAFFQHELWSKDGAPGRKYLTDRGIPEEQARERGLGYGGAVGKLLAFLTAKKVSPSAARDAGLLNEQGDRCLFDERLIFPIMDPNGRIAGFGGRYLGDNKADNRPKYVNTRESVLFSKRTLLYGWDVAQPTVRRSKRVVICEGYTDVLACQRAGIEDAVAALGTAFTSEHASLVKRLADTALIVLDSDPAGERASKEAAEKCIAAGLKTLIAPLPAGDDPDSVVRKSGEKTLTNYVNLAKPAVGHFIDRAFASPGMSIEDMARAAMGMWPLFKALGPSLERDLYMAQLANKIGIDQPQLETRMAAQEKEDRRTAARTQGRGPNSRGPMGDGRSTSPDRRLPRGEGRQPDDGFAPPDDRDAPPPDEHYAMDQQVTRPAPKPAPPPQPTQDELRAVTELLIYPSLRNRLTELSPFASPPLLPILEALVSSADPAHEILARQGVHARWVQLAEKAQSVTAGGPAEDDSNTEERLRKTFEDVLRNFERRHIGDEKQKIEAEIKDRRTRGDDTRELEIRRKDLTLRQRELKPRD